MATFTKDTEARTPFGKNAYLRSTQDIKTKSYSFAHDSMPTVTVDGVVTRVLQPGTVLALIDVGNDSGKVGVFQAAGSGADEVQLLTGTTVSAGTFDVIVLGETLLAVDWDVTAVAFQALVRAAVAGSPDLEYAGLADDIVCTGTLATAITITYNGSYGINLPEVVSDDTDLTGTIADSTSVAGVPGAIDGREDTANIVGICDTFLPWQLEHRDVEVACVYEASVVQAWCIEYLASGAPAALGDTTRDALVALATNALLFTS